MTRTSSLKNLAVLAVAALMAAGALTLSGCGEQESSTTVQSATPAAEQTATSSDTSSDASGDTEQDNCYGDDLPVVNNG